MAHQSFSRRLLVIVGLVLLVVSSGSARSASVTFEKILPLKANEGVFAYARISPNGRYLAYASEMPSPAGRGITQTETIVDLKDQRVLFTEAGIDGYFSNDNERMIFLSFAQGKGGVTMWHQKTGAVSRNVAPQMLGDYFSWSVKDGKNLILTIQSNFYELDGDQAVLPAGHVTSCPGIGTGDRPLISKDGRRITTFVKGHVVVRGLTDCNDIVDTGFQGAKADFSFDGRYVAFHVAKAGGKGSEIVIIDTKERTVRTLTGLTGDSVFPSWTEDGRLCFRYDGDDYRGFMFASNVLSLPSRPLGAPSASLPARLSWTDLFPGTAPPHRTNLVMIWSDWSPHAPNALIDLQRIDADARSRGLDLGVMTVVPEGSRRTDIDRILQAHAIRLPEIGLRADRIHLTGALNQIPTELLFQDGMLVEQRLGPMSYDDLTAWLSRSNGGRGLQPATVPGSSPGPPYAYSHLAPNERRR
ncbi:MAG TPA: hypothetical protein VMZ90_08910 [Vicinamibacterales bacterium]|nr:hypothetical protein [Vicinamibacterales bacterium]